MVRLKFSRAPPQFIGIIWLCLIGFLVWLHARHSIQPPLYDAFAYYAKAQAVWADLLSTHRINPLNVEPSFRPPFTVAMSYPLGFDADFRNFYFRSVFFSVVLVYFAVLLTTQPYRRPEWPAGRVVLVAAFLATPSLFFQFEATPDSTIQVSYWGLVDGFLTGLAALCGASVVRSIRSESVLWGAIAVVLGVAMIFVKPSGVLLAALAGTALTAGWLHLVWQSGQTGRSRYALLGRLMVVIATETILLGGSVWLALTSKYLGPENMALGTTAIDLLHSESSVGFSAAFFLLHTGMGVFLSLWVLMLLWHRVRLRVTRHRGWRLRIDLDSVQIVAALLVIAVGAWFWLVRTGGATQVRYFFPFLYLALVLALGPLLETLQELSPTWRRVLQSIMVLSVLNVILILLVPRPVLAWQIATGVNVRSGAPSPGAQEGRYLIEHATKIKLITVYSLTLGASDASFESTVNMSSFATGRAWMSVRRPVDWLRPSVFRLDEIIAADYIFVDPTRIDRARVPSGDPVETFDEETELFKMWAAGASERDGVVLVASEPGARLMQVVDRARLRASLDALVQGHRWRSLFVEENPPRWWSDAAMVGLASQTAERISEVSFDDVLVLRELTLHASRDGNVEVHAWIKPRSDNVRTDWMMLIHLLDAQGKMISNRDVPVGELGVAPPDLPDWYVHTRFVAPAGTTVVGVGFYHDTSILRADRGVRDWGERRVLLPLPRAPAP